MARTLQRTFCFASVLLCTILPASAQRGGFHGAGGFRGGGGIQVRGGVSRSHPGLHANGIAPRSGTFAHPGGPAFRQFPVFPGFRNPGFLRQPGFGVGPRFRRHGFRFFVRTPFLTFGSFPFVPFFPWAPFADFYSSGFSAYSYTNPMPEGPSYSSQPSAPRPSVPRQGVLVFKDGSRVDVQDYWLAGDNVHYLKSDGVGGAAPLSDLDLAATQQIDRERQQPFVLESRPQ